MITDRDIKKLREVFATKDDIKDLKNEIVKFKAEIVARLDTIDQELTVTNRYSEQLEDHDTRIKSLEDKLGHS